jgi:hypothetical protein
MQWIGWMGRCRNMQRARIAWRKKTWSACQPGGPYLLTIIYRADDNKRLLAQKRLRRWGYYCFDTLPNTLSHLLHSCARLNG